MTKATKVFTGGCLCGAVRYVAEGDPLYAGYCYCADCRKSSGSGSIPFMGYSSGSVRFSGKTNLFTTKSARGSDAVRNSCPICGSLVFGGIVGQDDEHTIYAGSLDDPSAFAPFIAIFTLGRPDWALLPPGLKVFDKLPM